MEDLDWLESILIPVFGSKGAKDNLGKIYAWRDREVAKELAVWDEAIKQGTTHRSSISQRIKELESAPINKAKETAEDE